jgi:hypothetical protein
MVEDKPLALFSRNVLSLAAPKPWLAALSEAPNTKLFVADIGISNAAWKRLGKKINRGIDFGDDWVIAL